MARWMRVKPALPSLGAERRRSLHRTIALAVEELYADRLGAVVPAARRRLWVALKSSAESARRDGRTADAARLTARQREVVDRLAAAIPSTELRRGLFTDVAMPF